MKMTEFSQSGKPWKRTKHVPKVELHEFFGTRCTWKCAVCGQEIISVGERENVRTRLMSCWPCTKVRYGFNKDKI